MFNNFKLTPQNEPSEDKRLSLHSLKDFLFPAFAWFAHSPAEFEVTIETLMTKTVKGPFSATFKCHISKIKYLLIKCNLIEIFFFFK